MKTIWKFPLPIADDLTVEMPKGARLLSVQVQFSTVCLWAVVDDQAPMVKRKLVIRGTGHNGEGLDAAAFVGTFQLHGGSLVFHLFDAGEAS